MNNSVRPLYHQSTVSKQTKILMQVRRILTFSLTIKQSPVQKCTKQSLDFRSKKELSHSIVRLSLNVFRWTLNDTPY